MSRQVHEAQLAKTVSLLWMCEVNSEKHWMAFITARAPIQDCFWQRGIGFFAQFNHGQTRAQTWSNRSECDQSAGQKSRENKNAQIGCWHNMTPLSQLRAVLKNQLVFRNNRTMGKDPEGWQVIKNSVIIEGSTQKELRKRKATASTVFFKGSLKTYSR